MTKKNCMKAVCLGLSLFIIAGVFEGTGFAQTTFVTVTGTIFDDQGGVLPGATITIQNEATGYTYSAISRSDGSYIAAGIQPGNYEFTVEIEGFSTQIKKGFTLNVGANLTINFTLKQATLKEDVTITAESPMVEVSKAEISSVVNRNQIENLPLFTRNFDDLSLLKAGVYDGGFKGGDVRASGLPAGSAEMLVDGATNEHPVENNTSMQIPADAIQEFRVITNMFTSEFGNSAGLLRSVITRSGTNDFKGRLSFFTRDEVFDTPNYFANHTKYKGDKLDNVELPNYEHYNFSGFLGGPIKKDKAHFFIAYEGLSRTTNATITSPIIPQETYEIPQRTHTILFKLNYQLNEKNIFSFRISTHRDKVHNYIEESPRSLSSKEALSDQKISKNHFHLTWTSYPAKNMMNESGVLFTSDKWSYYPVDPAYNSLYTVYRPSGYFGKEEGLPQDGLINRFSVLDTFSIFFNKHTIKVGFEYNNIADKGSFSLFMPGVLEFATDEPFNPANPFTYPMTFVFNTGSKVIDVPQQSLAFLAQDSWKVTPRLTLNFGLRYSYYKYKGIEFKSFDFPGSLNPRLGFSWDPVGDGKTAIRGGVGVFTANDHEYPQTAATYLSNVQFNLRLFPNYPDPHAPNPWWPFWEAILGMPPGFLSQSLAISIGSFAVKEDLVSNYSLQTSLGFQKELVKDLSVSADLVYVRGYHLLRQENLNPVIPGTGGQRVDPLKGDEWLITDNGRSEYKGFYLSVNKRYSRGWELEITYTLGWAKSDTEMMEPPDNYEDLDYRRQYGYINNDARHKFAATGIFDLPWGLQLSGVLFYRSALPWNAMYGYDKNLDTLVSDYVDEYRNSRRGFDIFFINTRISKYITFDRFSLQLFVEVYNITNKSNFSQIANNMISPNFGEPTAALDPRLLQLGIRFDF